MPDLTNRGHPIAFAALTSDPSIEARSHGSEPQRRSTERQADIRRWTINGDFLGFKSTGLARYGREITAALDLLFEERHPLTRNLKLDIVVPRIATIPLPLRHIEMTHVPEMKLRLPQVWVQFQLPRHLSGGLISFGNLAPIRVRHQVVCVHDLQTFTAPDSYGFGFRALYRLILPRVGRRAHTITTVSQGSKNQIVQFGIAEADKVVVIYNGVDHVDNWRPHRATQDWRRERPFVLAMGRNEAHKNAGLVAALAEPLDALGIDLLVAGDVDPMLLSDPKGAKPRNLHLLGRIGDDDLAAGLQEALCFVFPSRTEGFGFPAVEAMACGCPVVSSTAPCLPEVCGDAALYADPDDVDAWVSAILTLRNDAAQRRLLIDRGRARAARYSWRGAAVAYLELIAAIDESNRPERPANRQDLLGSPS